MAMVAERVATTGEVEISETREVPIAALRALHETAPCARVLTDFVVRALICDVIVHPDYQGRGIGRLLVEAVESHPALQQVEMLCLFTTHKRDFYAHRGWEEHPGHGMILRR